MKPEILFVDDEADLLRGLKRSLRSKRHDWNIRFAPGGQEALAMMAEKPAHIIVTDMRMPEIDGAMLLEEINEKWPFTCRLVLSGQADSNAVRKVVGDSHQFWAKPSDVDKLMTVLDCLACGLSSEELTRILAIKALPSATETVERLQDLLEDADENKDYIAELIGNDIALSAKMLQLSNSAYFGTGHATLLPGDAVRTLGAELLSYLAKDEGFVEPTKTEGETLNAMIQLLTLSTKLACQAEEIATQFPDRISDKMLFRQVCKFIPLGRLLGYMTGAKPRFDKNMSLYFMTLWGMPKALVEANHKLLSGDIDGPMLECAEAMRHIHADTLMYEPKNAENIERWTEHICETMEEVTA